MSTCHLSAATGHVGATRRRTLLASTALIAAALASPAVAETFWNSVAGNWATNANWTNNQPNATTDVTNVSNGEIAQIQTAAVAGTSFDMGARLKVNNGSTILLLPTGSLAFGGYADFNNGTLNLFSSTNVSGFIALTNSTISSNVDGTLTANISSVAGDNRIVAGNGTTLTLAPSLSFGARAPRRCISAPPTTPERSCTRAIQPAHQQHRQDRRRWRHSDVADRFARQPRAVQFDRLHAIRDGQGGRHARLSRELAPRLCRDSRSAGRWDRQCR